MREAKTAAQVKSQIDWQNTLSPLEDRLLLMAQGEAEQTAGGLYIPEIAQDRRKQALVLAVGPGKKDKSQGLRAFTK